jgi:hypothetical protein
VNRGGQGALVAVAGTDGVTDGGLLVGAAGGVVDGAWLGATDGDGFAVSLDVGVGLALAVLDGVAVRSGAADGLGVGVARMPTMVCTGGCAGVGVGRTSK